MKQEITTRTKKNEGDFPGFLYQSHGDKRDDQPTNITIRCHPHPAYGSMELHHGQKGQGSSIPILVGALAILAPCATSVICFLVHLQRAPGKTPEEEEKKGAQQRRNPPHPVFSAISHILVVTFLFVVTFWLRGKRRQRPVVADPKSPRG